MKVAKILHFRENRVKKERGEEGVKMMDSKINLEYKFIGNGIKFI